jgi:hypothetical protein
MEEQHDNLTREEFVEAIRNMRYTSARQEALEAELLRAQTALGELRGSLMDRDRIIRENNVRTLQIESQLRSMGVSSTTGVTQPSAPPFPRGTEASSGGPSASFGPSASGGDPMMSTPLRQAGDTGGGISPGPVPSPVQVVSIPTPAVLPQLFSGDPKHAHTAAEFLRQMEAFRTLAPMNDIQLIAAAGTRFKQNSLAGSWWNSCLAQAEQEGHAIPFRNWDLFKSAMLAQFKPFNEITRLRMHLDSLRMVGEDLDTYAIGFEDTITRLRSAGSQMSDEEQVYKFRTGLSSDLIRKCSGSFPHLRAIMDFAREKQQGYTMAGLYKREAQRLHPTRSTPKHYSRLNELSQAVGDEYEVDNDDSGGGVQELEEEEDSELLLAQATRGRGRFGARGRYTTSRGSSSHVARGRGRGRSSNEESRFGNPSTPPPWLTPEQRDRWVRKACLVCGEEGHSYRHCPTITSSPTNR